MCSLPRIAWTIGAASVSARAITSACAPAVPAPARIVTLLQSLSSCAARSSSCSDGTTRGRVYCTVLISVETASCSATSPGITSTATPCRLTASCIATRSARGICRGEVTTSAHTLHSRNSSAGEVSWKYSEPISALGMCAARASTGTRERCASYRPLMRCRFPGPADPAQTASRPVLAASAEAASAAASSWRTVTQSRSEVRTASVMPFSESPAMP